MQIVCPHCTTSYAVSAASLGEAGRTVRCSRCKEVWLARPEEAVEPVAAEAVMAEANHANDEAAGEWDVSAPGEEVEATPVVESPPIAGAFMSEPGDFDDEPAEGRRASGGESRGSRFGKLFARKPARHRKSRSFGALPTACAAMGALAMALFVWRLDVVRLLPQTAAFYRLAGLDVNLRDLLFKDVKVSTETVEGKPVLVIEGVIVGEKHKTIELPRLRFSVRDAKGTEIYAWNTVLEQNVLKPGEQAWFKSRLASPPAEGRSIDIRFFNKHDVAGGSA